MVPGVNPKALVTLRDVKTRVPPKVKLPVAVIVPVNVNPLTVPVPPTEVTPEDELVPAPIKVLISSPVTPIANVGVPPPENIPGSANDVYPSPLVISLLLIEKVTSVSPSLTNVTVPPLTLPDLT